MTVAIVGGGITAYFLWPVFETIDTGKSLPKLEYVNLPSLERYQALALNETYHTFLTLYRLDRDWTSWMYTNILLGDIQ